MIKKFLAFFVVAVMLFAMPVQAFAKGSFSSRSYSSSSFSSRSYSSGGSSSFGSRSYGSSSYSGRTYSSGASGFKGSTGPVYRTPSGGYTTGYRSGSYSSVLPRTGGYYSGGHYYYYSSPNSFLNGYFWGSMMHPFYGYYGAWGYGSGYGGYAYAAPGYGYAYHGFSWLGFIVDVILIGLFLWLFIWFVIALRRSLRREVVVPGPNPPVVVVEHSAPVSHAGSIGQRHMLADQHIVDACALWAANTYGHDYDEISVKLDFHPEMGFSAQVAVGLGILFNYTMNTQMIIDAVLLFVVNEYGYRLSDVRAELFFDEPAQFRAEYWLE